MAALCFLDTYDDVVVKKKAYKEKNAVEKMEKTPKKEKPVKEKKALPLPLPPPPPPPSVELAVKAEEEKRARVFRYLFALQDSGRTNMFGAGVYLQARFRMTESEAKGFVLEYMKDYEALETKYKLL